MHRSCCKYYQKECSNEAEMKSVAGKGSVKHSRVIDTTESDIPA